MSTTTSAHTYTKSSGSVITSAGTTSWSSSPSVSPSVSQQKRRRQQQQQLPSPRPRQLLRNSNSRSYRNNKKPVPFLSFQVQNKNCAVYVGNIPINVNGGKKPCRHCCCENDEDDNGEIERNDKDGSGEYENEEKHLVGREEHFISDDNKDEDENSSKDHNDKINNDNVEINMKGKATDGCCDFQIELKTFLRERINAAFKIPIHDIKILTCRFFSVVTHISSSSNSNSTIGTPSTAITRRHRAACVEFEDPKNAECCFALKNTSFCFADGRSRQRAILRMRRWTTAPPQHQQQSQKVQLQPPPQSTAATLSAKTSNGNSDEDGPLNLVDTQVTATNITSSSAATGRSSSLCAVHVRNLPCEVSDKNLRRFFRRRMNKAFHRVTPPIIIRIGIRRNGTTMNTSDAYVEFQDPKVAYRATILKNRLWHITKQRECHDSNVCDEYQHETDRDSDDDEDINADSENYNNSDSDSGKKKDSNYGQERTRLCCQPPVLEIEAWDSTKYNIKDFFAASNSCECDGNNVVASTYTGGNMNGGKYGNEDSNGRGSPQQIEKDTVFDDINGGEKKNCVDARGNDQIEQTGALDAGTEDAKREGFLICTNADKIPRLDHLFSVEQRDEVGGSVVGTKKACLCYGYAFRGNTCRINKSLCNSNIEKKNGTQSNGGCLFTHIDSFKDLTDPHDQLALLYYVNNNDEVEFVSGEGCSPQEYLLNYRREWQDHQSKNEKKVAPSSDDNINSENINRRNEALIGELEKDIEATHLKLKEEEQASHHRQEETVSIQNQCHASRESKEEALGELRSNPLAVHHELTTTQMELHESEPVRQVLLKRQSHTAGDEEMDYSTEHQQQVQGRNDSTQTIGSVQDRVNQLEKELNETNQKLKASERVVEESKLEIALLNEKLQKMTEGSLGEKSQITTGALQLELNSVKKELQQTRGKLEMFQQNKTPNVDVDTQLVESRPILQFDNFLETSIPTLMEMAYRETNGKGEAEERYSPTKSRLTATLDNSVSPISFENSNHNNASSQIIFENPNRNSLTGLSTMEDDRLRSEIALIGSFYGSDEVMTDGTSMLTRYLKLPVTNDIEGECINVDLVLTIPIDYPSKGIIGVQAHVSGGFGGDSHAQKAGNDNISSLLNVCRWEAEACEGKEALLKILSAAENWLKNDWNNIQKKRSCLGSLLIDYDSKSILIKNSDHTV